MKDWPIAHSMSRDQWLAEMDIAWGEWLMEEMAPRPRYRCRRCGFVFEKEPT